MPLPKDNNFTFASAALPPETFFVVRFAGDEGLSQLYRFEILLASSRSDVDIRGMVENPAVLTLKRPAGELPFHGVLESFEQLQQAHGLTIYRAVLVPRLWWLTLTHHNQVFLDKTCPQLLEAVLEDGGLGKGMDFELRLQQNYPAWEYACQYGESHFDFVSRWMERYGLYYFFEQSESGEKLIITDTSTAHRDLPQGGVLRYAPQSGLDAPYKDEVATAFRSKRLLLPRSVFLKDYDYEKPSLKLTAKAIVSPEGEGEVYLYGEHFRSTDEGQLFASVRAQELACRGDTFETESTAPFLRSGYTVTLQRHFLESWNRSYLVLSLAHEGCQAVNLDAGLDLRANAETPGLFYRNTGALIPAEAQFRPNRDTPRPRVHGVLSATVDAAGSGQYAELDEQGRYKVLLPFDLSGRTDGHASSWLRMMQPYVGGDHGVHLPLHKGAEVILSFIDGDPDRPFIAAAAPNPAHKSLVTAATQTKCMLTSSGQNLLHIEDQAGSERILMHSPTANTFLRIGAPNDPASPHWESDDENPGIKLQTDKAIEIFAGTENEVIMGESSSTVLGAKDNIVVILHTNTTLGNYYKLYDPFAKTWAPIMTHLHAKYQAMVGTKTQLTAELLKICEQKVKMEAMKTRLTAQHVSLKQSETELIQAKNTLDSTETTLNAEETTLTQSKDVLSQSQTKIAVAHTSLSASKTELLQSKTTLSENATALSGECTKLTEASTLLMQNKTTIAGTVTSMAEDFNCLASMTTKI